MSTRQPLLHLHGGGLSVLTESGGQTRVTARFTPDVDGQRDFTAWLERSAPRPVALLLDLPDERYMLESLPRARGSDRHALLERRQQRLLGDTPHVTRLNLGRETTGRRDERWLFIAPARPPLVEAWRAPLAAAGIKVRVLPLALAAMALIRQIRPLPPHCLLVTIGRSGLRVSCFTEGILRFSRLCPLRAPSPWQLCRDEVERIHRYLASQKVFAHDTPIPVFLLASAVHHEELATLCADSPPLQFRIIDLADASLRAGLAPVPDDSDSVPLLARLASSGHGLPDSGTPRPTILTAAAVTAWSLLGLAGSAWGLYAAHEDRTQAHAILAAARSEDARGAALRTSRPPLPMPREDMLALMEQERRLRQQPTLNGFLHQLSRFLEHEPALQLSAVDWSMEPGSRSDSPEVRIKLSFRAAAELAPAHQTRLIDTLLALTRTRLAPATTEQSLRAADMETGGAFVITLIPIAP